MAQCNLHLDKSDKVYSPGDIIRGSIKCVFTTVNYVDVLVRLIGRESTYCCHKEQYGEGESTNIKTRIVKQMGRHVFLSQESQLHSDFVFVSDTSDYPFSFTLPKNLLSTYRGRFGEVTYYVEAVVARRQTIPVETIQEIQIVSPIDLNDIEDASLEPFEFSSQAQIPWEYSPTGSRNIAVHLEKTAYTLGETIIANLDIDGTLWQRMDAVELKLVMIVRSKMTYPETQIKEECVVLSSKQYPDVVGRKKNFRMLKLEIPASAVVPNLTSGCLLDQQFKLEVIPNLPSFYGDLSANCRIFIGHIPIGAAEEPANTSEPAPEVNETPIEDKSSSSSEPSTPSEATTNSSIPNPPFPPSNSPPPYQPETPALAIKPLNPTKNVPTPQLVKTPALAIKPLNPTKNVPTPQLVDTPQRSHSFGSNFAINRTKIPNDNTATLPRASDSSTHSSPTGSFGSEPNLASSRRPATETNSPPVSPSNPIAPQLPFASRNSSTPYPCEAFINPAPYPPDASRGPAHNPANGSRGFASYSPDNYRILVPYSLGTSRSSAPYPPDSSRSSAPYPPSTIRSSAPYPMDSSINYAPYPPDTSRNLDPYPLDTSRSSAPYSSDSSRSRAPYPPDTLLSSASYPREPSGNPAPYPLDTIRNPALYPPEATRNRGSPSSNGRRKPLPFLSGTSLPFPFGRRSPAAPTAPDPPVTEPDDGASCPYPSLPMPMPLGRRGIIGFDEAIINSAERETRPAQRPSAPENPASDSARMPEDTFSNVTIRDVTGNSPPPSYFEAILSSSSASNVRGQWKKE